MEHINTKRYVRPLTSLEIPQAANLIWEVFLQFDAPDYSKEGIEHFKASLDDKKRNNAMKWYGAFDNESLIGVLAMRELNHIGGFFVKGEHQGKGVGKMLFEAMKADYKNKEITVNAAPYGVKIYKALGFIPTDTEQTVNGLRFTPMVYSEKEK